jgi:nitroimidazol reductase NimA-like FMN-containing flavoprotein (pyridoxamine 5'-phosphate oxidase superfamily)
MVLATADGNGKPWITPVAYSFDKNNSLYWMSSKDSRHSSNVRVRKEVAIIIYMTEPISDALYIEAEAQELVNDAEIAGAIEVINIRPHPAKYQIKSLSDVTGPAAWRIYKAVPNTMYVREQSTAGKQAVTTSREIT